MLLLLQASGAGQKRGVRKFLLRLLRLLRQRRWRRPAGSQLRCSCTGRILFLPQFATRMRAAARRLPHLPFCPASAERGRVATATTGRRPTLCPLGRRAASRRPCSPHAATPLPFHGPSSSTRLLHLLLRLLRNNCGACGWGGNGLRERSRCGDRISPAFGAHGLLQAWGRSPTASAAAATALGACRRRRVRLRWRLRSHGQGWAWRLGVRQLRWRLLEMLRHGGRWCSHWTLCVHHERWRSKRRQAGVHLRHGARRRAFTH